MNENEMEWVQVTEMGQKANREKARSKAMRRAFRPV
jgi:hypothetical protein